MQSSSRRLRARVFAASGAEPRKDLISIRTMMSLTWQNFPFILGDHSLGMMHSCVEECSYVRNSQNKCSTTGKYRSHNDAIGLVRVPMGGCALSRDNWDPKGETTPTNHRKWARGPRPKSFQLAVQRNQSRIVRQRNCAVQWGKSLYCF